MYILLCTLLEGINVLRSFNHVYVYCASNTSCKLFQIQQCRRQLSNFIVIDIVKSVYFHVSNILGQGFVVVVCRWTCMYNTYIYIYISLYKWLYMHGFHGLNNNK